MFGSVPRGSAGGEVTSLQKRILDHIGKFIQSRGYPPSVREIGQACGVDAPSSVAYHLRVLESKGLLKRTGSVSRGLSLALDPLRLPILGRVGAGGGMIAQEDVEGHLALDKDMGRRADFLLRVRGDSMTEAGILDGDLVLVRRQHSADDGDVVVAFLKDEGEGVVKSLRKLGRSWRLESASSGYEPIASRFEVVGRVLGLIRRY